MGSAQLTTQSHTRSTLPVAACLPAFPPTVLGLQRMVPSGAQFLLLNGAAYPMTDFNLYDFLGALRREVRMLRVPRVEGLWAGAVWGLYRLIEGGPHQALLTLLPACACPPPPPPSTCALLPPLPAGACLRPAGGHGPAAGTSAQRATAAGRLGRFRGGAPPQRLLRRIHSLGEWAGGWAGRHAAASCCCAQHGENRCTCRLCSSLRSACAHTLTHARASRSTTWSGTRSTPAGPGRSRTS